MAALQKLGCQEQQGYLYSKPLTSAQLERWLQESAFAGRRARNPAVATAD